MGRNAIWLALLIAVFVPSRVAEAETISINSDDEIVYFDGDHVIRIYDPVPSSSALEVQWASPEGGWSDFALGDLTGDGDMEIVAIRTDGDAGQLSIFDPVAQDSPADQVAEIDGVPWARLYDLVVPRPPRLIATGEFDRTRPGREILFSYALGDGDDRFVILRATGDGQPGRAWEELLTWDQEGHWSAVATGNVLVEDAVDEIGLVSVARAELALFRINPNVAQVFTNVNREHPWTDVAIGQYVVVDNDGAEIGAVRDADFPLASTWVFRYNGTGFVDVVGEAFSPSPNHLFFADLGDNGDEELVVLRQARPELGQRHRVIVRDGNSNDTVVMREDLLDGDNQYKGGDGGDIDGDGHDEIVLIRDNRIRIYPEPETSVNYELVERFTNSEKVRVGNVDAAGLAQRSLLAASQTFVSAELAPGAESGTTTISIEDAAKGLSMQYGVTIQGATDWIRVEPRSGLTPNELEVSFDADGIQPGHYTGQLLIDVATQDVDNNPLVIDLALTVGAVVQAEPGSLHFDFYPCTEGLMPKFQTVALSAASALSYTAEIEGNPEWITVAPEAHVLPDTVTVTVDSTLRPADIVSVDLLVTVDPTGQQAVVNRIPITLACPSHRVYAPVIEN